MSTFALQVGSGAFLADNIRYKMFLICLLKINDISSHIQRVIKVVIELLFEFQVVVSLLFSYLIFLVLRNCS